MDLGIGPLKLLLNKYLFFLNNIKYNLIIYKLFQNLLF